MNGQGISADPWADAIGEQQQERERSQHEQMRAAQEAEYAEMGEIVRRNAMENASRQMLFNNLLASAVKFSKFSNGGALPEVVRNYMNRKMKFDGVRTGILGGGYQPDGSYAFEFADGADGQGNVARQTQTFTPSSLYNMMNMNRVAFDDNDRAAMRKNLLSSGLSEREVETMDAAGRVYGRVADPQHISNMMGGGAGGRQIGGTAVMKRVDRRPHAVRAYSNVQTPGKTAGGRLFGTEADGTPFAYELGDDKPEAANWHQFSVGPSDDGKTQVRGYKNEVSGEVVYVKDGETPPWRQGAKQRGLSLEDRIALEREKTAGRKEVAGLNNETKLKVADIRKALKERGLDISEDKVAELIRHNKATEGLAGAKQSAASAPTFNKAIYERLSAKEDRLLMKENRTKEENEELARIQNKLRTMEGDDPVEKKPTPAQSVLLDGDTQGSTTAPVAKNPPAVKTPASAKATNGANAGEPKADAAQSGDGEVKNPVFGTAKQPQQDGKKTSLTPAEKSVGRDAVAMFKKIHPDITDVDDNPGKYDKQLTSIAQSLSGDYKFRSNYAIQKENDERAAREKEQAEANAKLEKYFTDKDKAVVQKAKELYAPLYERAKRLAMEDNGGDYGKSVRKKFAKLVKEYNKQNGLKFEDFYHQDKQVFGDYHVADLLSDVFGDDAGVYLGPVGNRGQAQRRLSSHGKDK